MKPSDFTRSPVGSVARKAEAETVARNVMVILSRMGDEFRLLSWDEYKEQRLKDGNFTEKEKPYFDQVVKFCRSAEAAELFSPAWADVVAAAIPSETKELFSETNLDYLDEPHRTNGQLLQAEMLRLQAEGTYQDWEVLCTVAADNLGNEDGRYYDFYVCLECGCLYHADYSTNTDPDRDFCKGECEVAWVLAHPDEPYNGEHFPQDEEE